MGSDLLAAFDAHPELVDYGRYAMQIEPFVEAYGNEAVLLTSLERIKADPQGELERICAHIGLRGAPAWRADLGAQNVSAERIRKLPLHDLLVTNPVATALRRTLIPKGLRRRIQEARRFGDRPELPVSLRTRLAETFSEDLAALQVMFPDVEPCFGDMQTSLRSA